MATFIRQDDRRIVFKRIGDERVGGVILLGFGALFASIPIYWLFYWLSKAPARDTYAIPVLSLFALVGVLICGLGLFLVLKSEWMVIDLTRGTYRGRRGMLFWRERLDGTVDDFDEIWIVEVPCEHDPNQRQWAVAWIWTNQFHQPFLVRCWGRQRSFHLARPWTEDDRLSFLRALRGIAKCTGLPLGVPRAYIDQLGVFDLSNELSAI